MPTFAYQMTRSPKLAFGMNSPRRLVRAALFATAAAVSSGAPLAEAPTISAARSQQRPPAASLVPRRTSAQDAAGAGNGGDQLRAARDDADLEPIGLQQVLRFE